MQKGLDPLLNGPSCRFCINIKHNAMLKIYSHIYFMFRGTKPLQHHLVIALLMLFMFIPLFSCKSDKTSANISVQQASTQMGTETQSAAYSVEIIPENPNRRSTLQLIPKGFSLSDARISWLINGIADPEAVSGYYQPSKASRGDVIEARVAFKGKEIISSKAQMVNTPPEVTQVRLLPETFRAGDKLRVEPIAVDDDGDSVAFTYEWTVNGEPAGKEPALAHTPRKGDFISVTITPFDGTDSGKPVTVQRTINNMPPVIIDHNDFSFEGNVYTYQVKAYDADGDKLTYSLEGQPADMTIDPETGLIKWVVPAEFKGKKDVTVRVSDGNNGTARYSLAVTIR